MASVESVFSKCSRQFEQNFCLSEENLCVNCLNIKDYIQVLTTELKSAQLIIKIIKLSQMASEAVKVEESVAINQFYQSNSSTNAIVKGVNSKVISKVSPAPVVLDELQYDLSELIHILHVTERSSVKEIIQADIQLLLSKIESIEDLNKNQFIYLFIYIYIP